MTQALINTQITIILYLIIGFTLYKFKIFTPHAQVFISDMTINVLLPASVFASFIKSMSIDLISSLFTILIFATVLEIGLYVLTKIKSKWFTTSESAVLHYSMLVSNGGLVGTPVIQSLFGDVGVMYCNVFMIPTRIMAYSAGESVFNPLLKRGFGEIVKAVITNKIIISMALALLFISFNITIPNTIMGVIESLGGCLAPFSLMLVGSMLAQKITFSADMIEKISFITAIRLVLIPLVALIICLLFKLDFTTTAIIVMLMGMPVGSSCASFSKKYKGNEAFASSTVLISTLLSTISLVILMRVMEVVF